MIHMFVFNVDKPLTMIISIDLLAIWSAAKHTIRSLRLGVCVPVADNNYDIVGKVLHILIQLQDNIFAALTILIFGYSRRRLASVHLLYYYQHFIGRWPNCRPTRVTLFMPHACIPPIVRALFI